MSTIEMVRNLVDKESIPIPAELDRTDEFPEEIHKKAAAMGLSCLNLPEEYSGIGMDYFTTAFIGEELSRSDCDFASALGVTRYALELALIYSQQRKTYGKLICKYEMIQEKIADMGMAYEAARQLTWRAAAALDAEAKETIKLCAMAMVDVDKELKFMLV